MREQVLRTVEQYIEAVKQNDTAALPLHDDVVAVFPLNTYRGIGEYRAALGPFHQILKGVRVRHLIADDEHCIAIVELDTAFGMIPMAEHMRVLDGRIVWIRAYFDPRPVIDGIARMESSRT